MEENSSSSSSYHQRFDNSSSSSSSPSQPLSSSPTTSLHHRNHHHNILGDDEDDNDVLCHSHSHHHNNGNEKKWRIRNSGHQHEPLEIEDDSHNNAPGGLVKTSTTTTTITLHHHHPSLQEEQKRASQDLWQTIAGIAGNVLEWYDFAIFGSLGDVIGQVFFPPSSSSTDGENDNNNKATMESFAVFGGAFLVRPIGGLLMGYIGDVYGRKRALTISIFLMAFPTFCMGCLPSYNQVGFVAIVLLVLVRLLQGLSVGGQLMSSLVFTLENHDRDKWGLYGSYVMAAANCGTLLGNIAGTVLRASLSHEQLVAWGWRVPFLSGIFVSLSGFYLRSHGGEGHVPVDEEHDTQSIITSDEDDEHNDDDDEDEQQGESGAAATTSAPRRKNPLLLAFAAGNRRSLAAAAMVPMLSAGGFYLCFVWLQIYMAEMIDNPVPHAFAITSVSLLISVCLFFPVAGALSDRYGRRLIMAIGGVSLAVLSPLLVMLIGRGNAVLAFFSQCLLGFALSFWGSPMCAWLVEAFEPEARLTSVAIGHNMAMLIAGGSAPAVATIMVDKVGQDSPGWFLTILAIIALTGFCCVAPPPPPVLRAPASTTAKAQFAAVPRSDDETETTLERTSSRPTAYLKEENEII